MQSKMLINGEMVEGDGEALEIVNPATGEVIHKVREASDAQIAALDTWMQSELD
jgi:aminobutyraldehyde dehydrogenase